MLFCLLSEILENDSTGEKVSRHLTSPSEPVSFSCESASF